MLLFHNAWLSALSARPTIAVEVEAAAEEWRMFRNSGAPLLSLALPSRRCPVVGEALLAVMAADTTLRQALFGITLLSALAVVFATCIAPPPELPPEETAAPLGRSPRPARPRGAAPAVLARRPKGWERFSGREGEA